MYPTLPAHAGSYSVEAKICDGQPLCATFTFSITVIDDPATFSAPLADQTLKVLDTILYPLPAINNPHGFTITIRGYPYFMTIYASTLRIAPTSNSQAGTYPVTLEVYDGFSSSFSTFSLTVIPVEFMTPLLSSIILSLNNIGPPVFSKQLEALTVFEGEIA